MYILSDLSDEELGQLARGDPSSPRAEALRRQSKETGGLEVLIDEVEGELWARRLSRQGVMPDSDVLELLERGPNSAARKQLGVAAMNGKLSDRQLDLIAAKGGDKFVLTQVAARQLIREVEVLLNSRSSENEIVNVMHRLSAVGALWAVEEVCWMLSPSLLTSLQEIVRRSKMTRRQKHFATQEIRKAQGGKRDKSNG